MPSSTSNSRLPAGGWPRTIVLSIVLTLVAGAAVELWLRARGFEPSFSETADLWAAERERLVGTEPVALLGFSRMQLGVDPAIVSEALDRPVVQLAINATSPMPILADLAADDGFAGTVWVSVLEGDLLEHQGGAEAYVRHFHEHRGNLNRAANRAVRNALTASLAIKSPQARLLAWWESWVLGGRNEAPYITMRRDRYRPADYEALDIEAHRNQVHQAWLDFLEPWVEQVEREDAARVFADSVATLQERVSAIQARGGDVVLIRFPVSGPLLERERELFPRSAYWDVIVGGTTARTVHWADHPELRSVRLPDDSHVGMRDSPDFTRALARIVQETAYPGVR